MRKKLPNKPSALLRVAMEDLEKIEKNPKYEIDMSTWHQPRGRKCHVCFAGAVMAKHLGIKPNKWVEVYELPRPVEKKLLALNRLRAGFVSHALEDLGLDPLPEFYDFSELAMLATLSRRDRETWKEYMCDLIGILQAEGL